MFSPLLVLLPLLHSHNPFGLAFPSPNLFPSSVTHCAGKSDFLFSWGSKLRAQPGRRRMRSHILELSADPQGPVFTKRLQKNGCCCCRSSWRRHSFPPRHTFMFPHKSWVMQHTDAPWLIQRKAEASLCVCACVYFEGLLPGGSHVGRIGMYQSTLTSLAGKKGEFGGWEMSQRTRQRNTLKCL